MWDEFVVNGVDLKNLKKETHCQQRQQAKKKKKSYFWQYMYRALEGVNE